MAFEVERVDDGGIRYRETGTKWRTLDKQGHDDMFQALFTLRRYPKVKALKVDKGFVTLVSLQEQDLQSLLGSGESPEE